MTKHKTRAFVRTVYEIVANGSDGQYVVSRCHKMDELAKVIQDKASTFTFEQVEEHKVRCANCEIVYPYDYDFTRWFDMKRAQWCESCIINWLRSNPYCESCEDFQPDLDPKFFKDKYGEKAKYCTECAEGLRIKLELEPVS